MKTKLLAVAALAACSVALSGCLTASIAKMTPEQQAATIKALGDAGCSGTLHVRGSATTASGVTAGAANGEFDFNGGCDPSRRAVTVGQVVGEPAPATLSAAPGNLPAN